MTVTTTTNKTSVSGVNGTSKYYFTFYMQQASDLVVYVDDVLQTSGYTTSIDSDGIGGDITFATPMTGGEDILMVRVVPLTQATQLPIEGALSEETLENAFDKLTMLVQQTKEQADRAITVPITETVSATLPTPTPLSVIRWNAAGDALENADPNVVIDTSDLLLSPGTSDIGGLAAFTDTAGTQVASVDPGAAGQVLTSQGSGSPPVFATTGATGTVVGGGTSVDKAIALFGSTSGDLLDSSMVSGTAGDILISGGADTAPAWQTGVTVAQGGLGATGLTAAAKALIIGDNGAKFKELTGGTALQIPRINAGGTDWEMADMSTAIAAYRTTTPGLAIPSVNPGGRYSAAHGLGYTPNKLWMQLYCGIPISMAPVTAISKAASAVVSWKAHGFSVGNLLLITGVAGMTGLNNNEYTVSAAATDTFTITANTTAMGTYTAGTGSIVGRQAGFAVGDIITPEQSYQVGTAQGFTSMSADAANVNLSIASIAINTFFAAPNVTTNRVVATTGATIASDILILATGHSLSVMDKIQIAGISGTLGTLLNGNMYYVASVATNNITLKTLAGVLVDFNGLLYGGHGTVTCYYKPSKVLLNNKIWGLLLCAQ